MPRARKGGRIYWRNGRAYGDFRDYADVGGGREALRPVGTKLATDDKVTAEALLTARLAELKQLRKGRAIIGEAKKGASLGEVARKHLLLKATTAKQTEHWLRSAELYLKRAVQHFGASRRLDSIGVLDVHQWIAALERLPSRKGGLQSAGTIRHHLNALSNLYRRAQSLQLVPPGFNPVAAMMPGELPLGRREETTWFEVHEAAWLLEVARTMPRIGRSTPYLYEIVATLLLTGGRWSEVAGLEVEDVSFDRQTVTIRENKWRRLKTKKSARVVPLWPQLEAILRPHIMPADRTPREGLLFPGTTRTGEVAMVRSIDKALDHLARRAGWAKGMSPLSPEKVRAKAFRNAYVAARLQTVDESKPVALYVVAREAGHEGTNMIEQVYGHVGTVRHRAPVVEFRAEQHTEAIRKRFGPGVRLVPSAVTNDPARVGEAV